MISQIKYPDKYSFIGNPMRVTIESDSAEEVFICVVIEDKQIIDLSVVLFGCQSYFTGHIDISKILAPFFKKYEPYVGAVFHPLENFELNYLLKITDVQKNVLGEYSGKAFQGGITDSSYEQLNSWNSNIFDHRLIGKSRQFLFTTRTHSRNIVLRETEMYPFVFIHPGRPIKIITISGKVLIPEVFPKNTVCTFDIHAARKTIYNAYMEMPSFFVIAMDEKSIFEISLVQNVISSESYLIRFKNSLGAFEQIEVTGVGEDKTTYSEENYWMSFHKLGFFEKKRNRVTSQDGLIVETGYKSKEELNHLKDLIISDEIYFIDPNKKTETIRKCLILPKELNLPRRFNEPQSVELNIQFVHNNKYVSPELILNYPIDYIFLNITASGRPELNGEGFLYDDDFAVHAE